MRCKFTRAFRGDEISHGFFATISVSNINFDSQFASMAGGLKEVKNARDVDGIYTGLLRNGLKHGSGVLITQKGDRYEGEFKDGLKHGYGILTLWVTQLY